MGGGPFSYRTSFSCSGCLNAELCGSRSNDGHELSTLRVIHHDIVAIRSPAAGRPPEISVKGSLIMKVGRLSQHWATPLLDCDISRRYFSDHMASVPFMDSWCRATDLCAYKGERLLEITAGTSKEIDISPQNVNERYHRCDGATESPTLTTVML